MSGAANQTEMKSTRRAGIMTSATAALALLISTASLSAQDAPLQETQSRLAARVLSNPQDIDVTMRYARVSSELGDYEAAIGALERLVSFNPSFSRGRKELGFLYARLGAYEQATQNLRAALAEGNLDPMETAQIRGQLPDIEKRASGNRLSVRMQTGFRAQSNANFFPANNLFQVGGVGVFSTQSRVGDVNTFQMIQASHEYDFDNQNGDFLETHATAYATEQFKLPQYSVALFSASTGPRLFIPQNFVSRLSVRPYVTGLASMLGSTNYLNAGSAGVSFAAQISDLVVEPGFEWRSLSVNPFNSAFGGGAFNNSFTPYYTVSTIASGDVLTGYLAASYKLAERVTFNGRVAYNRANAFYAPQSSDQVHAQAMLSFEIDPLSPLTPRNWTIAPYGRFTHMTFDAPNPLLNPFTTRLDAIWTGGVAMEAPVTENFGFAGNVEYARNSSTLPNFNADNISVSVGPTLRF
jgi:tetratricopeptide (TPR) repeat protein